MSDFLKKRWPLIAILLVFIAFKIPHLTYPFYWDESWPYATAVYKMYLHGPSLLPGAIDGWVSRGHPLFFHASAALWMKVFGPSHLSLHSFFLFVSVCLIISVYEAGLSLFNKRVAIMAALLLSLQVIYFVQAAFVLPEIMVALLSFLSLRFYVSGRYVLTAIFLTALFYTKESGLFVGFVIGVDAFLNLFNTYKARAVRIQALLSVLIPTILIGLFFLLQKHTFGWYVLPLYTDLKQQNDWSSFYNNFRIYAKIIFYNKFQYYYFVALPVLSVLVAFSNKKYRYLSFLPAALFIYMLVDDTLAYKFPSWLFFTCFILSLCWLAFRFMGNRYFRLGQSSKFIFLSVFVVIVYMALSASVNCIIGRYMFAAFVLVLFWLAVMYDKIIADTTPALFYALICFFLYTAQHAFRHDDDYGDFGLKAFDGMKVHQGVVDYLEKVNAYDSPISAGMYLERVHLQEPASGFLHSQKIFKDVRWDIDGRSRYVIFDSIEGDYRYDSFKKNDSKNYTLVYRIDKEGVWAEIYKRK